MTTNVVTDEQLGILARRYNDLFRRLREGALPIGRVLTGMQDLIEGNFDAIPQGSRRLIDCDVTPSIPDGWSIHPEDQLKSAIRGQIAFDPAKVAFHLDDGQKDGRSIKGDALRERLEGQLVLTANVLDFLLANLHLIPESWKVDERGRTRYVYFWGTIYRVSNGSRYVRCLCWDDDRWLWSCNYLDNDFDGRSPAAVSASIV